MYSGVPTSMSAIAGSAAPFGSAATPKSSSFESSPCTPRTIITLDGFTSLCKTPTPCVAASAMVTCLATLATADHPSLPRAASSPSSERPSSSSVTT
jgi:hypothetical protein